MNLTTEKTMATRGNATDTNRTYTLRADVYTAKNGTFEAIRNGQVFTKDGSQHLAWFSTGVTEPLNISFASTTLTTEEECAVISDIQSFIAVAKAGNETEG